MSIIANVIQIVIALGIVNVWVLRHDRDSAFRPDGASNMKEEFARYGLPDWVRVAVGGVKLTLAVLLIVGIWYPPIAVLAGVAMAILMLGAVVMHVRVGDPPKKALPAFSLLVLSLLVALIQGTDWL